jgi:hypothetical protein
MIFAVMFLIDSYFPQDIQKFFAPLLQNSKDYAFILSAGFAAIAYALGVISEPIARIIFEYSFGILISKWRLARFLTRHRQRFSESPVLAQYEIGNLNKLSERVKFAIQLKNARSSFGMMRFYVLMQNSELYKEVESHINTLRLIRVLVIVEVIVLAAINAYMNKYSSPIWPFLFTSVFFIFLGNVAAVIARLSRYYRAIERSYATLVFEQVPSKVQDKKSRKKTA